MRRNETYCELAVLMHQARETERIVKKLREKLEARQQELRQFVKQYNEKWAKLFLEELEARKLAYCTRCGTVGSSREASLLFIEGRGSGESRAFAELHRMCGTCAGAARSNSAAEEARHPDLPLFLAFEVEVLDGEHFAKKRGTFVRLAPQYAVPPPKAEHAKRFMAEWRYPQMLSLDFVSDKLSFVG